MEPSRKCYTAKQLHEQVKHIKGWSQYAKFAAIFKHSPDRYNIFKLGEGSRFTYGIEEKDAQCLIDDIKNGRV